MRDHHVIAILVAGAAIGEASRTYLQTHRFGDAVATGLMAGCTTLVAGLARSPVQESLQAAFAPLQRVQGVSGGISADFPTGPAAQVAPASPAHE